MNWFNNRTIRTKIVLGFLLVALMAGAIGAVGMVNIASIARLDTEMYVKMTQPMEDLVIMTDSFQRIRNNAKDIVMAYGEEEIKEYENRIKERWVEFDAALARYETTLFSEEGTQLVAEIRDLRNQYEKNVNSLIILVRAGSKQAALEVLKGNNNNIQVLIREKYTRLGQIKTETAAQTAASNAAAAAASRLAMIIILAVGVVLSLVIGFLIANSISKPLRRGLAMIQELSKGRLGTRLHMKQKDEVGQMAQAMDQFADDLQDKVINILNRIAAGDVSADLELLDEQDEITPALIQTTAAIRALVADANTLVEAAVAGQLDTRADASRHQGDYQKIVAGVNRTLDAVIQPVQEASSVLEAMAEGNLQQRVMGDYQGDHAAIKVALNGTLDALAGYVEEIAQVLTEMANSNLDVAITGDYRGDFAPIKQALNLIVDSFNELLSEMNSAAEQVAAGSRQVSDGSQALSQGTTEQASSIEQLNASITEIAAQTKQNAINANEANDLAGKARGNAVEGNGQMKHMVRAMSEINESSTNISKIIKVIDEIAFQTNILALNAAVEAARAGQHGKGFAVVAEEVRNLAARSANAAKETTALIEGSIQKVSAGTRIADDTAKALDQIVNDVSRAADLVGAIAVASNEQATGIAQVNQGVEQVSSVVQANSATSEESAATSEELSSQADLLRTLISRFKLRRSGQFPGQRMSEADSRAVDLHLKKHAVPAAGHDQISAGQRPKMKINLNDIEFGKY